MTVALARFFDARSTGGNGKTTALSGADAAYASLELAKLNEDRGFTQVWRVTVSNISGTFLDDEVLNFGTSLATAVLIDLTGTTMIFEVTSGTPVAGETITGATSAATCTLSTIDDSTGASIEYFGDGDGVTNDTTPVSSSGSITSATCTITINGGNPSGNGYRLVVAATRAIYNTEDYITIKNCFIENNIAAAAYKWGIHCAPAGGTATRVVIERNNVKGVNAATTSGKGVEAGPANAYVVNNWAYGDWSAAILLGYTTIATERICYYNTAVGASSTNIENNGDATPLRRTFNNIAQGAGLSDYSAVGTAGSNLSSDATGSVGLQNITLTFADAANDDYHLASTDTAAMDVGTDLSADAYYPVSTDIDGNIRSTTPDLGADEYTAASSHDLTIDDVTSSASIDDVAITQSHNIAASDIESQSNTDTLAVTQTHIIAVDDAGASPTVDAPAVTQTHQPVISDATSAPDIDTLNVTQVHALAIDDASAQASIDEPSIITGGFTEIIDTELRSLTVARTLQSQTVKRMLRSISI